MSESVRIPDYLMQAAARKLPKGVPLDEFMASCQAFAEALAENPTIPTDSQIRGLICDCQRNRPEHTAAVAVVEWQRRMFSPEPPEDEAIRDLLVQETVPADYGQSPVTISSPATAYNKAIREAFNRGRATK